LVLELNFCDNPNTNVKMGTEMENETHIHTGWDGLAWNGTVKQREQLGKWLT